MKYHIVTLGCQMNVSDSERTCAVLDKMGYVHTDNEEEATIIGILACSVRQKAIDKVYARIHKWNRWKNKKNLITFISGCILPKDHVRFLKLFDLIFLMKDLPDLPDMIRQYGIHSPHSYSTSIEDPNDGIEKFWELIPHYQSDFEAFIPIQNGCDKFCSFCAVPYTRGREISRPSKEIISEVKNLVEKGYKSITLLGQNVNSYGLDKRGKEISFSRLLDEIGKLGTALKKDFWVYFTSPHPRDMTEEVIDVIAKYACLAKQIHLPVQSGDDKVLQRMNRKHDMEKYRKIVHSIRSKLPEAALFTDIIVGFTGETEEEFGNTLKAMEAFRYNMAYIAQYSPRPGAKSSQWMDDIPKEVKKERLHLLTATLKKHSFAYNQNLIGKKLKVLVKGRDKRKPEYLNAYSEGRIVTRFISENDELIGNFVDLTITSAADFSVEGTLYEKTEKAYVSKSYKY